MRSFFAAVLVVLAAACGGEDPAGPDVMQIGGQCRFTETYTDTRLSITCNDPANVTITQTGDTFRATAVQTGTCTAPAGSTDNSGTFQLSNGRITASEVSWRDDGEPTCQYTGTITGTPPNRMSGNVACTGVVGGTSYDLRGTWQMTR